MNKKKLLYASPFPPQKSGISDYSKVLASALRSIYDVTLLIDDYTLEDRRMYKDFTVMVYGKDKVCFADYDYLVYNIGNNPEYHSYIYKLCLEHPGLVILHDVVLYYLYVGVYQKESYFYSKIYKENGLDEFLKIKHAVRTNGEDLLSQKEMANTLKLNREILESGNKIMVHSWYAYNQLINSGAINEKLIRKINHLRLLNDEEKNLDRSRLLKKYCIPEDAFIVASFGYIAETKLNREVCKAVKKLNEKMNRKICYVMVGEGNYVDDYVDNQIIFKTGYTELVEFNSFIDHSDIIMNLRYPSMGETSGAMLRILQKGKLCFINKGGWFSEIPDDCVVVIDLDNVVENLCAKIAEYMTDEIASSKIKKNAKQLIETEYSENAVVEQIKEFLEE